MYCLTDIQEISVVLSDNMVGFVHYIGPETTTLEDMKEGVTAYIETIWDFIGKEVTINAIETKIRNVGIGTMLINLVIDKAKSENYNVIVLDDMSKNYRKENNIYKKLGFVYVSDNGPEMIYNL